ncbi:MAG: helix-turn-helix domain-containing protein [Candidatus Bathyarchaeia archaeon]|nr:transcriptional regulator [Candidatus Bathyarchaeota archaeon]
MRREPDEASTKTFLEIIQKLETIIQRLDALAEKIDKLSLEKPREKEPRSLPMDVATLLSLPDHLRKTALILCNLGEATAEMVAKETGRARAAESDYLNQLASRGYIKKKRIGRKVYFQV